MKTNKIVVFFSLLISIVACTKKVESENEISVLKVNWNQIGEKLDYSYLMEDSVQVIPLEDRDDCLVGKVSKLILQNDLIYIADELNQSVFVFDLNGKFVSRIHAEGSGPGEYVNITSFTVLGQDIVVFDHLLKRLFFYKPSGEYVRSINVSSVWATDLFVMDGRIYLFNDDSSSASGFYHLFIIDPENNDKIENEFPFTPKNYDAGWGIKSYYAKLKDEALITCFPFDTLYQVKNDKVAPAYTVDFGNRRLPESYIYSEGWKALTESIQNNYVLGIDRINQTEKYIFIQFKDKNSDYISVYDKKDKSFPTYKKLVNGKLGNLLLQPTSDEGYTIQENKLIQCYPGDYWMLTDSTSYNELDFYSEEVKQKFIELCRNAREDSNPVVFIQHFKK